MEFGTISFFGAVIVVLMLIPNVVYAVKNKGSQNLCTNRVMNLIEQVGRYACIVLMWLPLLVRKFGFASVFEFLLYLFGNGILLAAYWIVFAVYMKKKSPGLAFVLAVLPAGIFLLSGILLRHWLLVGFAILFAVGHIYVTKANAEQTGGTPA
ncbi:MAG: hypothetical protein IJL66_05650 [Lachnospiraceae bacterium]|nr:hypothetical protein [Lachnospiraceae bacterium]